MRDQRTDIIKGILILSVVAGHISAVLGHYMNWFHVFCFFMVAGFFLPDPISPGQIAAQTAAKARRLLVPYLSYLVVMTAVVMIVWFKSFNMGQLRDSLFGGNALKGPLTQLWFTPVLFFSLTALSWIRYLARGKAALVCIMAGLFAAAHLVSIAAGWSDRAVSLPLQIDGCLIAVPFIWLGSVLYRYRQSVTGVHVLVCLLALGVLGVASAAGLSSFNMNMHEGVYRDFVLDMAVPVMSLTVLYALAGVLVRWRPAGRLLAYMGRRSMSIFYIHTLVLSLCWSFLPHYSGLRQVFYMVGLTVVSVSIPLMLDYLFSRWRITRVLFLGEN